MSSAIGEIIYGVDLTDTLCIYPPNPLHDVDSEELEEFLESHHVSSGYSGNGETPRWFGIQMGSISEGNNEAGESLIAQLTASEDIKTRYLELLNDLIQDTSLSDNLRRAIQSSVVRVWLLWGSS